MAVNDNRDYVNYNDRDNPVPGSAADVAKRKRESDALKTLQDNKDEIDKAVSEFPVFGKLLDKILNKNRG